MSKYIKREDAIKQFEYEDTTYESAEIVGILADIPSADVVEVVRCKDCKCFLNPDYHPFEFCMNYTNVNCYCSYGERKDNE